MGPGKGEKNLKNHTVSFDEASTVFSDPMSLTVHDPLHSDEEDRFVIIGKSYKNRLLLVVHVGRGSRIRIISARKATRMEKEYYEENET